MSILRKLLFSSLFIQLAIILHGQEQLGLRLDNYAGVSGILSNPASSAGSYQQGWDINLFSGHLFFSNNIAYLENTNLLRVSKNTDKVGPNPALDIKYKGKPEILYNFYDNSRPKFASMNFGIMGPSAILNMENGNTFGIYTTFRSTGFSHDLPSITNAYEYQRRNKRQAYKVEPFEGAILSWGEIGFHYAFRIGDKYGKTGFTFGTNLKYLRGYQGGFIKNYSGAQYTTLTKDSFVISTTRAVIGFTDNYKNPTQSNGSGYAVDFGAMLTTEGDEDKPYGWRLGVSFLDLGTMHMNKNVQVHNIVIKESADISTKDFTTINLKSDNIITEVMNRLSEQTMGDRSKSYYKNNFYVLMPAVLQITADYAVRKDVFINALLQKRVTPFDLMLERDDLLAITPRYETRWIGASMPISLVNFNQLHVGLAARVGFLTFGTDYLGSFFGKNNVTGTDFYMALKVNPFEIGKWTKREVKRNPNARCYRF